MELNTSRLQKYTVDVIFNLHKDQHSKEMLFCSRFVQKSQGASRDDVDFANARRDCFSMLRSETRKRIAFDLGPFGYQNGEKCDSGCLWGYLFFLLRSQATSSADFRTALNRFQ